MFGLTSVLSGLLGVSGGSLIAQKLRPRVNTADPLVCAIGMIVSAPLMYLGMVTASNPKSFIFVTMFFAQWFLNLNWSLVADMLLVNGTGTYINIENTCWFNGFCLVSCKQKNIVALFRLVCLHFCRVKMQKCPDRTHSAQSE